MYVRKLKHSNGKVYVQVIDKSSGKYKVVKSFGSAVEQSSIDALERKAELWIKSQKGIVEFDFQDEISLFAKVFNLCRDQFKKHLIKLRAIFSSTFYLNQSIG